MKKNCSPFYQIYRQIYLKYFCQKLDQNTWGKWLIQSTKYHKDNQSQKLQHPSNFTNALNHCWHIISEILQEETWMTAEAET